MNKVKYTTYLAGAIEHASSKEMTSWRKELSNKLLSQDLLIYDPVKQESNKVGKASGQHVEYIKGLKRAGHWDKFYEEMWKIWFGKINPNTDIIDTLHTLRTTKHISGNAEEELKDWGDFEAVVRSDFIVVYLPKATKTVGTIYEIMAAFLFRIPIYLIIPDAPKTETNSSLLFGTQMCSGEVFYSVNECVKYIIDKYKLNIIDLEQRSKDERI